MEYLSDDPTVLAAGLLLTAAAFVVAMRATQQGKYLICAVLAAVMAVLVVAVEWLWVTDNERIEQVVYALRDAVLASDAEAALAHMTPDVAYVKGDVAMDGDAARALVSDNLGRLRFEIVRITHLETNVAAQSRRGTANFGVFFKGATESSANFGSLNSSWSLGLRETEPGVWKVNRITPVQVPGDGVYVPGGRRRGRIGAAAGSGAGYGP